MMGWEAQRLGESKYFRENFFEEETCEHRQECN